MHTSTVNAIARTDGEQTASPDEPTPKRSRRRRKGGIKSIPDGAGVKQAKQNFPTARLIMAFLSGLSAAEKGLVLAYLLDQAKSAQAKPEGGVV